MYRLLSVHTLSLIAAFLFTAQIFAAPSAGTKITNSIGMKLSYAPAGSFMMGSARNEKGRKHDEFQHQVTLTKGFYIGVTEVTQKQWKAVMATDITAQRAKGARPWALKGLGDDIPMYYVSWNEASQYCAMLSQKEGKKYRLPTEAEWEYAARAGSALPGAAQCWNHQNSGGQAHPAGKLPANSWGLHDMHGNVREWCNDNYGKRTLGAKVDPRGSAKGLFKVIKGGSWKDLPALCRSAMRHSLAAKQMQNYIGFRVVMEE